MPDLSRIQALSFDCYGTLIDWEIGILKAIRPVLSVRGIRADDADLLRLFARLEAEQETGSYQPYRDVLHRVMVGIGAHFGVEFQERERDRLVESIARWEPFPDTVAALERLHLRTPSHPKLVVCSNIDDDLFQATYGKLGIPLDRIVTAEYCRSYKPDPRHFRVALALLGLPPDRVLHVAESLRHDIAPAKALGMPTVWVNRHKHRPGPSASGSGDAVPDLEVPDLKSLAELIR